jgi:type I restriction enzyme S subunit
MDQGIVARDSMNRKMAQSLPPEESLLVQPGDLVYNTMRMWQGAVGYSDREGVVSPAYVVCRPNTGLVDGRFVHCLFKSRFGQNKLQAFSHGLTEDRLRLYFDDFAEIPFRFPPLCEQRKIADILGTWDEALDKLDALIAAKDRRKQALMQQLLTGERRLPGFIKKWSFARLDQVFEPLIRKAPASVERTLSITAGVGFVDQREKFNRVIAGANLANYVLLKRGEFSYNKGNSNVYAQGCIYRLEEYAEGAVPNVWISFRLRSDEYDSTFYKYFFLAGGHSHQLHRMINYGVRNNGLLNLTAENFFTIKVPVPEPREQQRLGSLFDQLATDLRLLRQQRVALDQQKRGLMQLLLTGKKRVRV